MSHCKVISAISQVQLSNSQLYLWGSVTAFCVHGQGGLRLERWERHGGRSGAAGGSEDQTSRPDDEGRGREEGQLLQTGQEVLPHVPYTRGANQMGWVRRNHQVNKTNYKMIKCVAWMQCKVQWWYQMVIPCYLCSITLVCANINSIKWIKLVYSMNPWG